MKKIFLIQLYLFAIFVGLSQTGYYYGNEYIRLGIKDSSTYYVSVTDSNVNIFEETYKNGVVKIRKNGYIMELENTEYDDMIAYKSNIYSTDNSNFIVILPTVTICLYQEDSVFSDLLRQHSLSVANTNGFIYRVSCDVNTSQEVLLILSEIQELENVKWCEPEMLIDCKTTNTLYGQQYYLKNTGQNGGVVGVDVNVEPAWNLSDGNGSVVAVIDEGVDRDHEDLQNRVLEGYTVSFPNGLGAPQNYTSSVNKCKGHGVACAGIIAAMNNTIGIRGIAGSAEILPVNIVPYTVVEEWGYYGFGTSSEIASAINWAWKRADVLSCSWGGGYSNEVKNAIDSALIFGRGGKGSIVVAASGNNYPNQQNVSFPSLISGVLTVGAINNSGVIWGYSQRGAEMDLVAPSGNVNLMGNVVTTDRMGSLGYNTTSNGHYTDKFGGTSAACPQVSGIVALMLSANPNLTVQQVTEILRTTARDLGVSGFDLTYGYGLVDAHLAVVHAMEYGHVATITGSNTLADCEANIYQCDFLHPEIFTYSWSASSNLNIIENHGASVRVMPGNVGTGTLSVDVYQQGRLMYSLTKSIQVTSVWSGITPISTTPFNITSNTTWSSATYLPVTATIDPNVTLTITSNLLCGAGGRLIVRPGGKLVVDGGTLTSACPNEMWQGIEVVGDRTKQQLAQYQGKVELKNGARIENALCAIRMGLREDTVTFATTGGIISASNATFKNNRQSVMINSYAYTAPSGGIANYNSTFSRCTFTIDNSNLFAANNTAFAEHVRLWDVKGVTFEGCTFNDLTSSALGKGRGIYAADAGVLVNTYCPPQPTPVCECPETDATYSFFSGFTTAVEVNTSGNPYAVRTDEVRFSNNSTGVSINGNQFATVTRCQFNLDQWPASSKGNIGLYLNGCSGYTVEGNTFKRTIYPTSPLTTDNSTGICVSTSGITANSLYRNVFEKLTKGIHVIGINGSGATGLRMTCNDFSNGKYDIHIAAKAKVANYQGTAVKGADNIFASTITSSIFNESMDVINYYYGNGSAPISPYQVTTHSGAAANLCASTLCDGGIPGPGPIDALEGDMDADTYYTAVRTIMSDTVLDLTELEQWHAAAQPIGDPYSLAETRFMEGYVETFAGNAEDVEMANYAEFHAMKVALRDNASNNDGSVETPCNAPLQPGGHINWYALTPAQIAQLQTIAERNTGRTSAMAKGVLCFFHGICYEDEWDDVGAQAGTPQQGDDTTDTRAKRTAMDIDNDATLSVYPNPTDDLLFIELAGGAGIANIALYDLQGRKINSPNSFTSPILDMKSVPAGVYILRVTDTDGKEYHQKIVRK